MNIPPPGLDGAGTSGALVFLSRETTEALGRFVDERLDQRLVELGIGEPRPEWLTLEQAANRYATSAAALRKRCQRGRLPGAVRDGGRWLVDRRALDRALKGD
jgi:hypothetical protein